MSDASSPPPPGRHAQQTRPPRPLQPTLLSPTTNTDQSRRPGDPRRPTPFGERIQALDTVRGFALCGIIYINIGQIFHMVDRPYFLENFVYERFLTIFALLFGVGFGIFLLRARAKGHNARVLLLRRLLVLGVLGGAHQFLQPGEALLPYAIGGLIFLLPLSFLPRPAILVAGIVLLVAGTPLLRGYGPIPGLLIIGFADGECAGKTGLPGPGPGRRLRVRARVSPGR